ncbi:hypothetical protein [Armatimonas rosea]|uniref:Uncharacterized protein n=1 Tax=Armatimonas rosea TaxID=685828 RepID=A0A7W9SR14_ARMRO|nr:hypothetical protein [Armatimonas rosea]MBB6050875.1 hypothetical protein [Armatimonas rosea]
MSKQKLAWYLWAIGTVLIVLSWFNIVPYNIGWVGFVLGLAGSILSWGLRPPRR